jgi:hypothetical protein
MHLQMHEKKRPLDKRSTMAYEKDQHPSAPIARMICLAAMILATLSVIAIYFIFEQHLRETALVRLSFVWLSTMAFGGSGILLAHKGLHYSLGFGFVISLATIAVLELFYQTIWPSL